MPSRFVLKENRDRNRPMAKKMPKAQLADALAASDRIFEVSCEIRGRAGLKPLERSRTYVEARARLGAPKAVKVLGPAETLAELAKRRSKLDRDRDALDRDIRELAASKTVGASMIARALGISRQRVYQLAA